MCLLPPHRSSPGADANEHKDTLILVQIHIDKGPAPADAERMELFSTLRLYQNGKLLGVIAATGRFDCREPKPANRVGSRRKHIYDMLVIGGGPGGLYGNFVNRESKAGYCNLREDRWL